MTPESLKSRKLAHCRFEIEIFLLQNLLSKELAMLIAKSLWPESWTRDQLHEQLVLMTIESDRLIREAFRQKVRAMDRATGVLDESLSSPSGVWGREGKFDSEARRRSDEYLSLLACCGGPCIHGEPVSTFDFFVYLELIPQDDLHQIRGEEELSAWLDRIRTLLHCGFFDESTVELARTKVQYVLRRRMLSRDRDSQSWLESLRYFSHTSNAAAEWMLAFRQEV